ncbi:MAG: hypothetical protein PVF68_12585 [Acidobacteriota bacterium]|jgi:hypothetical protein
MSGRYRAACIVAVLLMVACVGDRPVVERFVEGSWEPAAARVASLTGGRDGTAVRFRLRLAGEPELEVEVEATLEIDPRPRLVAGRWSEGAGGRSGPVSAAAIDFFGGQGGVPSLRGQLTLAAEGAPIYRIHLPTTPLERAPG